MNMSTILLVSLLSILPSFSQAQGDEACVKGVALPADFDATVWPEMWRLTEQDPSNPMAPNQGETVEPQVVAMAGVQFMQMDPGNYTYPANQVPWEPEEGAGDPALEQLREDLNYSYADIITVTSFVEPFWEEHFHAQESIRYILNGSGFFDVRDVNDEWVRMHVRKAGFMILPAGINHRFVIDSNETIHAMRLFQGSPIWTAFPREDVKGNHTARNDYVDTYLCGIDPDLTEAGGESNMVTSSVVSLFGLVSKSALALLVVLSSLDN